MTKPLRTAAAYAAAVAAYALPALVLATGSPDGCATGTFCNPIKADSIEALLVAILKFMVRIATVACVIFLVWSGFLFVKAQGNEEGLKKAKSAFFYAVIGTVLMLGAEVIAAAIQKTIEDIG